LQRVGYQLEDKSLYRLSWPVLDRVPNTEPHRQKLIDGVESLNISFFDQDMQRHATWPLPPQGGSAQPPAALPKGVEVQLEIETLGSLRRVFRAPETLP
jgi:general secretion pathway protein J